MKRTRSQWDRISLCSSRVRSEVRHSSSLCGTSALIQIKASPPKKEEPSPKSQAETSAPKPETLPPTSPAQSKAETPSKPKEDKAAPPKEKQAKKEDKSASTAPLVASGSRNETRVCVLVLFHPVHRLTNPF